MIRVVHTDQMLLRKDVNMLLIYDLQILAHLEPK